MTSNPDIVPDIIIVGGGIAGITLALDLLESGDRRNITLLDRGLENEFGGLARSAFGGMALSGTELQKRNGITDSPELILKDWKSFADFSPRDTWPKIWAQYYAMHNKSYVYDWIKSRGVKFLPAVQWVERGLLTPGNSVPRYHILWGTGKHLTDTLIRQLKDANKDCRLTLKFGHTVKNIARNNNYVTGVSGIDDSGADFEISAQTIVLATGGIGGNIDKVKNNWPLSWGKPPSKILNGCHPYNDGIAHAAAKDIGGSITHLDKMWNYAAGVHNPAEKFKDQGLSLIPTRSSLWLDHTGERIGPQPLITGFDTNYLCQQVAAQSKPWTWHVMNWKIARRELAISGADHNPHVRDRRFLKFIISMLRGDPWLISKMVEECEDFIIADTLDELAAKMNQLTETDDVDADKLSATVGDYDTNIRRAPKQWNDDQIRRLQHLRQWTGDRIRTCKFQPIVDKKQMPLVAIRTHLISRKTLGGIQTNLDCQVMGTDQAPIQGLYAIGEAAGFGGGGASGKRSLEGTFLSGCILTARRLAAVLTNEKNKGNKA